MHTCVSTRNVDAWREWPGGKRTDTAVLIAAADARGLALLRGLHRAVAAEWLWRCMYVTVSKNGQPCVGGCSTAARTHDDGLATTPSLPNHPTSDTRHDPSVIDVESGGQWMAVMHCNSW